MVVLYTPPKAETVSKTGLTLGVRVGVGFPGGMINAPMAATAFGGATTGEASDLYGVMIPITIDIGYRLNPHWYVGAYLGIGYTTASICAAEGTDAASCSETVYRFGAEVQYRILPRNWLQPWIAAGAGWEVANQFDSDAVDGASQFSISGLEFAHLTVGTDFRVLDRVRFGPYFETSFAEYQKATSSNLNGYVHEWFIIGAMVRYDTNWLHL